MNTGTQLFAPEGYDALRKNTRYHLLRSDPVRGRVILVEFAAKTKKRKATQKLEPSGSLDAVRPVLHYVARQRFEHGLETGMLMPYADQEELPPWFNGWTINDLRAYAEPRAGRKQSHDARIDRALKHIWPLVRNLDQVLSADCPDALVNAHARACVPQQNPTRLRAAFYSYICYGCSRWALHYAVHTIGRWDRMGRPYKLGRPSSRHGAQHGHSTCDPEMIKRILEGFRKYAKPGKHLSKIYRETLTKDFGCIVQTDPSGRKSFIHPTGQAFPTLGQFCYRVGQEFPLVARQTFKYGQARLRNRLTHTQGPFAESVGNLMERSELDAYQCDQVAVGYQAGSHLPPLWVVRIRCIASGMIIGVGFSFESERASAYRMAQFCAAINKVKFCSLFGYELKADEWPSVGISPHAINDRGPGSTAKGDPVDQSMMPVIKEGTPSHAGQSKASVETLHPKQLKLEGQSRYQETRLSIPQLAIQEIERVVADNNSIDVSDRLNNQAWIDGAFPTPVGLWNYLGRRGRSQAVNISFEEAVRSYLTPIKLSVHDDAVYYLDARFDSKALRQSGILQQAHDIGRFTAPGYMMDACVRHLWLDLGDRLVELDAMLSIRDGEEQLYVSVVELDQISKIRRHALQELVEHKQAVRAELEANFQVHTGQVFDQASFRPGRPRRHKAGSKKDRQGIMDYLRAAGGAK